MKIITCQLSTIFRRSLLPIIVKVKFNFKSRFMGYILLVHFKLCTGNLQQDFYSRSMPSEQVYFVLDLQHKLNRYQLVPFPLHWNPSERIWHLYNGEISLIVNLKFAFLFIWKVVALGILMGALHIAQTDDDFSVEHIFACFLSMQIIGPSMACDACTFMFGQNLVTSGNWRYRTEDLWRQSQLDCLSNNTKDKPKLDLLAVFIIFFLCVCSLFYIIVFVGTAMDWDPLNVLLVGVIHLILKQADIPLLKTILAWNSQIFPGKIVRIIILYVFVHMAYTSVRVSFISTGTGSALIFKLQKMLLNQSLGNSTILKYRQLQIDRNILYSCEKILVTALFGGGGLCLQLSIVSLTICLIREQYIIAAASAVFALGCMFFLLMALYICCLVNDLSLRTLTRWEREVSKQSCVKYWSKVVRSCRPLAFPAGDVGIINKELKMNFFQSELINTINLLAAVKDFIRK